MLAKFAGKNETPLSITPRLKFSNGLILWKSLTDIYPDIVFVKRIGGNKRDEIQSWLSPQKIAICKINLSKRRGKFLEHWAVFWENIGVDDFIISDSAKNKIGNFNHLYKVDRRIYAAALFEIRTKPKPKPPQMSNENAKLKQRISILEEKISRIKAVLK